MSSRRRRSARAAAARSVAAGRLRRIAGLQVATAGTALAIAVFLLVERLAGGTLVCGPLAGCDTVQASPYALVGPLPVAAIGVLGAAGLFGLALVGWRDQRARPIAYVLGLAGCVVAAYLTLLELAVIHAVCTWCVAFAVSLVASTILAGVLVRRS